MIRHQVTNQGEKRPFRMHERVHVIDDISGIVGAFQIQIDFVFLIAECKQILNQQRIASLQFFTVGSDRFLYQGR
jgi:hypothetical protein